MAGGQYFDGVSKRRGTGGGFADDPHDIIIAGLDKEASAKCAAQFPGAAEIIAELTIPSSNEEIGAFLKNPDKFFESYPVESSRSYMLNMLKGILERGGFLRPQMVRSVGEFFVIDDGRHHFACARVAYDCLKGVRSVRAIEGLVQRLHEERGVEWLPDFPMHPPKKDARTGAAMNAADAADLSNLQRPLTDFQLYERAMMRVRADRASDRKPDWVRLGESSNKSPDTIEGWEHLSKMPQTIRDYVLVGHEGRRFPLTSALALRGLPDDVMIAKAQAMLAAGDTRVATAKATAKDAKEKIRDREDRAPGGFTADSSPAEVGEEPKATRPREEKPPREHEEKPEAPSGSLVRATWKARDLRRFVDEGTDAVDRATPEWAKFAAAARLFTEGPDKVTKADLQALGDLGVVLDKFINPSSPKLGKKSKK